VSHGSAGPYEIVVLRSEEPGALTEWLQLHDYAIQDDITPVIDAYVAEGFDFVALRLVPSADVQQMRPVRVVQEGAVPTLPLRMVAAGSGARTAISLFVIAEARYTTANFYEGAIREERLEYDFATGLSNYATLRDEVFEANGQQTFLASYAQKGALFRQSNNPTTSTPVVYRTAAGSGYVKMADAYVEQGFANGEASSTSCAAAFDGLEQDKRRVVNPCDEDGACRDVDPISEIDARTLACDAPIGSDLALDDIAVALTGMHPADVWVTRLDANLGRDALQADLDLKAHAGQSKRPSFVTPQVATSTTCEIAGAAAASTGQGRTPRERARLGMGVGLLAVLLGALTRRILRLVREARPRNTSAVQGKVGA